MALLSPRKLRRLLEIAPISRRPNAHRLRDVPYQQGGLTTEQNPCSTESSSYHPPHYLTVNLDNLEVSAPVRYWDVPSKHTSTLSFTQAAEQFREAFLSSIEECTSVANGPVSRGHCQAGPRFFFHRHSYAACTEQRGSHPHFYLRCIG